MDFSMIKKTPINGLFSCCLISMAIGTSTNVLANAEFEAWKNAYKQDSQKTQQEFQQYLEENDKAFIGFLKANWKEVEIQKPKVRDPKPKPVALPVAKPEPVKPKPEKATAPKAQLIPIKKPTIEKPAPVKPKSKPVSVARQTTDFEFYGQPISVSQNKKMSVRYQGKISNEGIADYWQSLASQPHKTQVKELLKSAQKLKLNDWSTALLFDQYARQLHPTDSTSRQLTSWFLLVKAGFNARVAYNDRVFLLMPTKQELYSVTYFTFDGTRYYAVNLNDTPVKTGRAYTYSGSHTDGKRVLDFSSPNAFVTQEKANTRTLSFKYNGKTHTLKIKYNAHLVPYFATYPQLDLKHYFAAGMPSDTRYQLLTQLKPLVEGKSEKEAVNLLLRFVQKAFEYKTDDDQFNQENYLFPLETLHYPYSDCEDRSALFAWLTNSLLGLDTIILMYPGHVATAVAMTTATGDTHTYQGKRYSVADPTYINANVGMTMPSYRGKSPKVMTF